MKKIILLLVVALLPSFLSAQIQDKSIAQKIWDGQMWDEMDRWPSVENARGIAGATSNFFEFAPDNISDWLNDRDRIYRVEVPPGGFLNCFIIERKQRLPMPVKTDIIEDVKKQVPLDL